MPRLEKAYSSRARTGVTARSECPTTLQSRASIFQRERHDGGDFDRREQPAERASNSGTDASIIASTSRTMMATISWTKREPTECGR